MPTRKKPYRPTRKYLIRYEAPALVEEWKRWRQAWRTEEDHLLFIQQVADADVTPSQLARTLGVTKEHASYLLSVAYRSKDQRHRDRWLARFEQNEIDPYHFGHA